MDDDNAIEVSGDHGASTHMVVSEQFETPTMPHYPPLPWKTPTRYREEIKRLKKGIASMKGEVERHKKKVESKEELFKEVITSNPSLANNLSQQITSYVDWLKVKDTEINMDKQRLF